MPRVVRAVSPSSIRSLHSARSSVADTGDGNAPDDRADDRPSAGKPHARHAVWLSGVADAIRCFQLPDSVCRPFQSAAVAKPKQAWTPSPSANHKSLTRVISRACVSPGSSSGGVRFGPDHGAESANCGGTSHPPGPRDGLPIMDLSLRRAKAVVSLLGDTPKEASFRSDHKND
ncbi:MAG: hypothetical protein JWQ86_6004 [Mycobacterium sp.]|jgi:hypothetical protein|nr:hypothetical protein [Mycobacterium sp.]MDT5113025.1 hypothetical protein [Mycobacterium sp.]